MQCLTAEPAAAKPASIAATAAKRCVIIVRKQPDGAAEPTADISRARWPDSRPCLIRLHALSRQFVICTGSEGRNLSSVGTKTNKREEANMNQFLREHDSHRPNWDLFKVLLGLNLTQLKLLLLLVHFYALG